MKNCLLDLMERVDFFEDARRTFKLRPYRLNLSFRDSKTLVVIVLPTILIETFDEARVDLVVFELGCATDAGRVILGLLLLLSL